MSIILVLKESDTLILSTDSRMMAHDNSGVVCDAEQKIFEIGPGTFIAVSGRKMASEFQAGGVGEIARELGTTDIQAIGAALERESLRYLMLLLARLRLETDETTRQAVSGDTMLHGCTLVGRSACKLGYVSQSYWVQADGTIKCTTEAYFEAARRKVAIMAGTPARILGEIASRFMQDMATWTDPLEQVSMRLLEAVKRSTPTIGGPYQVVRVDSAGAHWISQPQRTGDQVPQLADGICTATISLTSPVITGGSLAISAGAVTASVNSALSTPVGTVCGFMVNDATHFVIVIQCVRSLWNQRKRRPQHNDVCNRTGREQWRRSSVCTHRQQSSDDGATLINPGAGSKQFWYDPADSNRVKFAV